MTARSSFARAGLAILTGVLIATPAAAQTLGLGQDVGVPWLRLILALLVCLGLAVGAVAVQRRRLGQPAPRLANLLKGLAPREAGEPRITRIQTRRLAANVTVSTFHCDSREFMLAASAQGQLVLVSLDAAREGSDGGA